MKTFIFGASLSAVAILGGCVEPVNNYGYGAMPVQSGMAYQEGGFGYDTYGQPYTVVGGQPFVIIYEPNRGWGYYDSRRQWREAPRHVIGALERDHPRGNGLPPARPIALPGSGGSGGHYHMGVRPQSAPSPMAEHPQGQPGPMGGRLQGQTNQFEGRPQGQTNQFEGRPQSQPGPMGGRPQGGVEPMPAQPRAGTPPAQPRPQGEAPRNKAREIKR